MTALTAGQAAASLAPAAIPVATPNSVRQWWTLSTRAIRAVVVNGEIIMAFVSPAFLAVCFYLPLRNIMNIPGMNYAQFLMPIIVLQSVAFTATSAAMRSALDGKNGDDRNQHDPAKRLAAPLPDRASRFRHAGQGT